MKKFMTLVLSSLILIFTGIAFGSVNLPFSKILGTFTLENLKLAVYNPKKLGTTETIILQIRMPRVLLAYLVGLSLASAGTASQALFKNPLADPYILGISGGAAVGAALAALYFPTHMGVFALIGALISVAIVYNISKVDDHIPVDTLLLAGIAFGFFAHAVTSYLLYVGRERIHMAIFWLMGTFNGATWDDVKLVLFSSIVGFSFLMLRWKELNLLLFGEESIALGLDLNFYRKIIIFVISMLTAFAVATSGIIGFVGLISPHAMRLVFGPNHKNLLPAAALFGGSLMVFADLLARIVLKPAEIPVGIITALFGAPFFIYLLMKRKRGELYA
ncbi:iron chelate uptake ABC transporter family permease subunit [Thermococcus sp. SY098]|uniref:FecCD family ABC transporter permease n=1 Tax=Thermococcus sp. SY098 TaxID=3111325 RepID=UPI002D79F091|nr:iron chelate uptake ABC transporter family permease subunit [Thermococcus sp. SY098]WRS52818.1 iron chelate uptake ABC transporter family permease subunit [Thermococcus sp. SY098]